MDYAHKETDKLLGKLERKLKKLYKQAAEDLTTAADAYLKDFAVEDAKKKALVDAGAMTDVDYRMWRLENLAQKTRFNELKDEMTARMLNADKIAADYINDATPAMYALNRNWQSYNIEQATGNIGFSIFDESTVKRLVMDEDALNFKHVQLNVPKDTAWTRKRVRNTMIACIMQGKSIPAIASEFQTIAKMGNRAAVANARTCATSAQNAGRQDSMQEAVDMGIKIKKEWMATLDGRTRHEHGMADGQQVDVDKPFNVGGEKLMYPADENGSAHNIYNCRCTMVEVIDGVSRGKRRIKDPITGEYKVVDADKISYKEWLDRKTEHELTGRNSKPQPQINLLKNDKNGIIYKGKSLSIRRAAKANPHYGEDGYDNNCQRCVQAYELRRRGYNVVAKPRTAKRRDSIVWGTECFIDSGGNSVKYSVGLSYDELQDALNKMPRKSRSVVYLQWKNSKGAHVIIAEKANGRIMYIDPQNSKTDVKDYFDRAKNYRYGVQRIDNLYITTDDDIINATVEVFNNDK